MSRKKVAIIDYKMGNMYSVQNACEHIGLSPVITTDGDEILNADAAILPGVGAFGQAMEHLEDLQLIEVIYDFINSGKPFMGICLGFQLLFSSSSEFGSYGGLDLIEGNVIKFPSGAGENIKVPQIGWNRISLKNSLTDIEQTPLHSLHEGDYMYFVHSYYVDIKNEEYRLSTTSYANVDYCSSIIKNNIFGTQFHPEKSGKKGLEIYKNWASLI